MELLKNLSFWRKLPNRDEALELVYSFLKALSLHESEKAEQLIYVQDMSRFMTVVHDALYRYLDLIIEDEQWDAFKDKNLVFEIDDPAQVDEDLILPEFNGRHFDLEKNEILSVKLSMHGQITPVRLHFAVAETDELYFLKLQRITAER